MNYSLRRGADLNPCTTLTDDSGDDKLWYHFKNQLYYFIYFPYISNISFLFFKNKLILTNILGAIDTFLDFIIHLYRYNVLRVVNYVFGE